MTHKNQKDNREKFMFVYEDDTGTLFTKLSKIENKDKPVKIFPVFFTGGNENLTEEIIEYKYGKWGSKSENSWLKVINSRDEKIKIMSYRQDKIVVYNDKLFHCEKDLLDYLEYYGPEVLPVSL